MKNKNFNLLDISNQHRCNLSQRHLPIWITSVLISYIIWFTLTGKDIYTLPSSERLLIIFTDCLEGLIENILIIELSLLISKYYIDIFWNKTLSLNKIMFNCGILMITILIISGIIAGIYAVIFPREKLLFQRVLFCDTVVTYFTTSIYMLYYMMNLHREEMESMHKAKSCALESQLARLQLKTDNHFVFNSLTTLGYLIDTDPIKASEFNDTLSRMYRFIVSQGDKKAITLNEEFAFIKDYTYTINTRYDGIIFNFITNVQDYGDFLILPLSLHGIIGNAIKHNKHGKYNPLTITLTIDEEYIYVSNNINILDKVIESTGIGLSILSERYKLLSGKDIQIINDGHNFSVALPVLREYDIS